MGVTEDKVVYCVEMAIIDRNGHYVPMAKVLQETTEVVPPSSGQNNWYPISRFKVEDGSIGERTGKFGLSVSLVFPTLKATTVFFRKVELFKIASFVYHLLAVSLENGVGKICFSSFVMYLV